MTCSLNPISEDRLWLVRSVAETVVFGIGIMWMLEETVWPNVFIEQSVHFGLVLAITTGMFLVILVETVRFTRIKGGKRNLLNTLIPAEQSSSL